MSSKLSGFLFGNVDAEGHLEDSGLGEELRDSLQKGAEEGAVLSQIFSVQSLGIEEMEDEEAAQSEASVPTPVRSPEESSIRPTEDAIDYFDTNEVIADPIFSYKYYQQGINSVRNFQKSSIQSSQLSQITDDSNNYDEEEIKDVQISQINPPVEVASMENNYPASDQTLSLTMQNSVIDIKTLYPAFEKDKILKFSELFANKARSRKLNPVSRHAVEKKSSFKFELDDMELFESSSQQATRIGKLHVDDVIRSKKYTEDSIPYVSHESDIDSEFNIDV
ncbi:622_t:CDS:2, partial [Acaulospora colombiana]